MTRDLAQLTRSTVKILRATELDQLPDDGTESFGVALEHVMLFQAGEIERLEATIDAAKRLSTEVTRFSRKSYIDMHMANVTFEEVLAAAQAAEE